MLKIAKTKLGGTKVTFSLPSEQLEGRISVVGDFNQWTPGTHELRKRANGTHSVVIEIPSAGAYKFRYLGEGGVWLDEPSATAFDGADAVLDLTA